MAGLTGGARAVLTRLAPRWPASLSLRTHLLALAVALVLPTLALGTGVTWRAITAYRGAFEQRLGDTARALSLAMDREIGTFGATLTGLAAARLLDADATEADLLDFRARAATVADALGTYVVLVGPAPDYRTQVHTLIPPGTPLPSGLRLPEADAPVPRVFATGRPAIGGVARGVATDRQTAFIFLPVTRDGRVIRAIGMALDPARLAALLQAQGLPDSAVAAVVDARGTIAARSRAHENFVGRPAPAWFTGAIAEREGGAVRGTNLEGQEVLLAFARLPSAPGWTVAVAESLVAYEASWMRPLQALALGGGALLLLGLSLAWWLGRSLLRPVRALAADAAAVAATGRGAMPPAPVAPTSSVTEFEALRCGFVAADAALRERADQARAGEERMGLAVESTGMGTFDLDHATGRLVWSRHHFLMLGYEPDAPEGPTIEMWRARVHPEDLARVEADWAEAEAGGGLFHVVYRIRRADDLTTRWMEAYGRYIRDGLLPGRFVGVMFDVTERKAAEEHELLLMREVDHRAKNALAVVQSVVRLTRAEDASSFATAVEGRVRALARAHDLLARDRWIGANLRELAADELAAHLDARRVAIEGPPVRLVAEAAQPLSMVLHELTTNAAKHGALSQAAGRIELSWRIAPEDGTLRLRWIERDGPPVSGPPRRTGFGTRLMETTLRGQLGGGISQAWEITGLRCDITIAASRITGAPGAVGARIAPITPAGARIAAPAGAGIAPLARDDASALRGLRVLVVEDEALIATDLAETLGGLGCEVVGPAGTLEDALQQARTAGRLDAAVLDVNLHGKPSFPVAEVLAARDVPVVFATGYGHLPETHGGAALLRKPVAPADLAAALRRAVLRPTPAA